MQLLQILPAENSCALLDGPQILSISCNQTRTRPHLYVDHNGPKIFIESSSKWEIERSLPGGKLQITASGPLARSRAWRTPDLSHAPSLQVRLAAAAAAGLALLHRTLHRRRRRLVVSRRVRGATRHVRHQRVRADTEGRLRVCFTLHTRRLCTGSPGTRCCPHTLSTEY